MSLITYERWANRDKLWKVAQPPDVVDGRAEVALDLFGIRVRKRFLADVQADAPIDNGRQFDLNADSRLKWWQADNLAPFEVEQGELDHLCLYGAQVSSLTLDSLPAKLRWQCELTSPVGTRFVYQPKLTAEEIAEPCMRPFAVVGSYAMLDATGCKIGHALCPVARDRDGKNPVRGTLEIANGLSTVTFTRQQLEPLALPITIFGLDTFGYSTVGGTANSVANDFMIGWGPHAPASDGSCTAVEVYASSCDGDEITLGLYDHKDPYDVTDIGPGNRMSDSAEIIGGAGAAWRQAALDSAQAITNGTNYWLCGRWDTSGITCYYDTDFSYRYHWKSAAYIAGVLDDPFPDPPDGTASSRKYTVRGVYTPSGAFIPYPHLHGLDGGMSTLSAGSAQE